MEKIAQLYFYPETPDRSTCNNFFRITDNDVLFSLFDTKRPCGSPMLDREDMVAGNNLQTQEVLGLYKYLSRLRTDVLLLIRDLVWSLGKWKTPTLKGWLHSLSPECVFFVGSESGFSYDIALWISEARNIPLYLYCTDDYVTARLTLSPFYWIKYFRIRKRFVKAKSRAKRTFVIGEKMADEYARKHGGTYTVIMNMVDVIPSRPRDCRLNGRIRLVYAGNLELGRWRSLLDVGRCLLELEDFGLQGELVIYSRTPLQGKSLKALSMPPFVRYCGSVNTEKLTQVLLDADILVHVEGFGSKSSHVARLSVSTKIPEYLAVGRCILAYGPYNVASIEHLQKYDAALVACSKAELHSRLREALQSAELRNRMGKRAHEIARSKHSAIDIMQYLEK